MFEWLDKVFRKLGELRMEDLQASDWLPLLVVLVVLAGSFAGGLGRQRSD